MKIPKKTNRFLSHYLSFPLSENQGKRLLFSITLLSAVAALPAADYTRVPTQHGEYGPSDALLEGSNYLYYGSETPWTRRYFEKERADEQDKRRGQRQFLTILDGDYERAVAICKEDLNAHPGDPESLFNLTIAQAQLGQISEAFDAMKQAMDNGVPWERFIVGPRKLLEPLTESEPFQAYRAEHPVHLVHGPMLGSVTARSVRVWVRTAEESRVVVSVYKQGKRRRKMPVSVTETFSDADEDYTTVSVLDGLEPDTRYAYEVVIDGVSVSGEDLPGFRTLPDEMEPARFQIAFGGGSGYTPKNERMWTTIKKYDPLVFMTLGDNVYVDLPQIPGPFHDYTYYRRQSRPEWRELVASTPVYAIWDDHDAAINDSWLGPYRNLPELKLPMLEHFRINWNNPGYGDADWPGVWHRLSIADVDFFLLDGRTYRTNPFEKNPTMLGPAQKAWLFEQIKRSRATFKVIISPVSWSFLAKKDSLDTWSGFKEERNEIFDFLDVNNISGVFLLAADRHRSEVWVHQRENAYPLYEFSSSQLTNVHTHPIIDESLYGYNETNSFGLLDFNTQREDPEVQFKIINIEGEEVYSIPVTKSQLIDTGSK